MAENNTTESPKEGVLTITVKTPKEKHTIEVQEGALVKEVNDGPLDYHRIS